MKTLVVFMARLVRNFLVSNIFVFVPLLLAVCWSVSDRLDITVDAMEDVTVKVYAGASPRVGHCGTAGDSRTARIYYADGCDADNIRLEFSVPHERMKLSSVELNRHFLFKKILVSRSPVAWSGYRFALTKKWWKRIALAELLLIVGSFVALFMKRDDSLLARCVQPAVVAVHAGLFLGFVVPFGTWLGNRALFPFSAAELLPECLIAAVAVSIIVFACLSVSWFAFDRFVTVMMTAVLVYEYLLTGILSAGLPALDGDFGVLWESVGTKPDFIVMFCVVGIFAVGYHWLKRHVHYVSLAFLVLSLFSLVDVALAKPKEVRSKGSFASNSINEVVRSVRYSAKRNVLVFVVDAVRADVAARLASENKELRDGFDGFAAFDANLGMHPWSQFAVPGLTTGEYYVPGGDAIEFLDRQRGESSFVSRFDKAGAAVYYGTDTERHRYTNRFVEPLGGNSRDADKVQGERPAFLRRTKVVPNVSLAEVVRFRLVPMFWKAFSLNNALIGAGGGDLDYGREKYLYPVLADAPVDGDLPLSLVYFHTNGSHPKHKYDKQGNVVSSPREPRLAEYEHTYHVFDELIKLFGAYKERGIYDKSMILVMGDHGNDAADRPGEDGRAHPMLWIKPFQSRGELVHSQAATSHDKIRELMEKSISRDLSLNECEQTLTSRNRKYVFIRHDGSAVQSLKH